MTVDPDYYARIIELCIPFDYSILPGETINFPVGFKSDESLFFKICYISTDRKRRGNILHLLRKKSEIGGTHITLNPIRFLLNFQEEEDTKIRLFTKHEEFKSSEDCKELLLEFWRNDNKLMDKHSLNLTKRFINDIK
jgi:hypothetical protein